MFLNISRFAPYLIALLFLSPAIAGVIDNIIPCVIFLTNGVEQGQKTCFGSGFLIRKDNSSFIVTASHVAKAIGPSIKALLPCKDGHADTARFRNIEWKESQDADVAIGKITLSDPTHVKLILKRCLPISVLSARPLPPSRDITLTVMGYPLGLGSTGYISPLSLETKAASGFITFPRFDNRKNATFILLQDPSIGGLSGGPVFDMGISSLSADGLTARKGVSLDSHVSFLT